jgi:hypothetical protein
MIGRESGGTARPGLRGYVVNPLWFETANALLGLENKTKVLEGTKNKKG